MRPTIGILGGIGAEASALFYQELILRLHSDNLIKSNTDYPHIIINSIPAPELFLGNPDLEPYMKGLEDLEKAGAEFAVMVCNTAHLFLEELKKNVNIPVVDLKKEVKQYLIRKNIKYLTVLGTKSVVKKGLFNYLEIKYLDVGSDDFDEIEKIIMLVNTGDKVTAKKRFENLIKKYMKSSATILVACTELSILFTKTDNSAISTFDILLDSAIKFWKTNSLP